MGSHGSPKLSTLVVALIILTLEGDRIGMPEKLLLPIRTLSLPI